MNGIRYKVYGIRYEAYGRYFDILISFNNNI
jgi:hypothetical protein